MEDIKKKYGFTLIEVLAIIIILSIIAVITVPVVLNVIDDVGRKTARLSALGYIKAIEKEVLTASYADSNEYADKEYAYDEIPIDVEGNIPTAGFYDLLDGDVTYAIFCISGYAVSYQNGDASVGQRCETDDLKYDSTLSISKNSTFLAYPAEDSIQIIENTSNGEVTCLSSNSDVATCEIDGNNVIIKSGVVAGQSTITLTSHGGGRYKNANAAILVSTEPGLLSMTANDYSGVYDGNFHGISVSSSGAIIKYGTVEGIYDLDVSPTYSDVGSYTVYYEVTRAGYVTVTGSRTVTITRASGSVTAPTAKSLTYNNLEQELINAGSSLTGTIEYKLNNGSYSTSIPTATNSGTYTVYYRVIGDNNHNDVAETSISVTINKANNTLTLSANSGTIAYPNNTTFAVNKNTSGGTLSCSSSNTAAATCSVSGTTVTVNSGTTAASSVNITVTSAATTNYNSASAVYVVTNNLGTLSVTANGYSNKFDGNAHGITVTSSGATIKYGTSSGTYNLNASPTYTNVGTYTVYYQITKTGYTTVTGSRNVVISDLTAGNVKYTKNGQTTVEGALDDLFTKFPQ